MTFVYINGVPVSCCAQTDGLGNIVSPGGAATVAIPANTTTDTVVKAVAGRLCRVLVTALGTATGNVFIFDNASTATGTVIGMYPGDADIGALFEFEMPAANGITVQGVHNSPGVTISFY
jgi:hypothetical protein